MDKHIRRWWQWFALALFLLVPLDLFLTLLAVAQHGAGVEVNPLMRWLLEQGLVTVTVANLIAVALAVYLFDTVIEAVRHAPASHRDRFVYGVTLWLGVVFVAGVVLTANNLLVII